MRKHYHFGTRSMEELEGVHPKLVMVCAVALHESEYIDWGVFDGVRTQEEQAQYVDKGVSWTMESLHLPQEDGYGHAVDLVPWIGGKYRWDSIEAFQEIGRCMKIGSKSVGISLTWGANRRYGGDWRNRNDMAHFQIRAL